MYPFENRPVFQTAVFYMYFEILVMEAQKATEFSQWFRLDFGLGEIVPPPPSAYVHFRTHLTQRIGQFIVTHVARPLIWVLVAKYIIFQVFTLFAERRMTGSRFRRTFSGHLAFLKINIIKYCNLRLNKCRTPEHQRGTLKLTVFNNARGLATKKGKA